MLQRLKHTALARIARPVRALSGLPSVVVAWLQYLTTPTDTTEPFTTPKPLVMQAQAPERETTPASLRHMSFTFSLISLAASVARADGSISRAEYLAFRDAFPLTGGECGKIRQLFTLACESPTPFTHHVQQVRLLFPGQKPLYLALMDKLFAIASADVPVSPPEGKMLARIAKMLELSPAEYSTLYEKYSRPLAAHHVLGVKKRSPRNIVKKRYYALMQRYHPDRFAQESISPEVSLILSLRASEITSAYRTLSGQKLN
jgi:DnaJ like chaperone protein